MLFRVFTEWSQYYYMLVTAHKYITGQPHTVGMVRTCLLVESEIIPSKILGDNRLNIQQEMSSLY